MERGIFRRGLGVLTVLSLGVGLNLAVAWAGDAAPDCQGAEGINNSQILTWKTTTPNSYLNRGHVEGDVTQIFPDRNGHQHFEIKIGPNDGDTLEIIYNQDFGNVPTPNTGDHVEACGDYITSTAQSGPYPASPDGAILHWIHEAPNPEKHPSGYLMINGQLYGQNTQDAGPYPYPRRHHHGHGGNGGTGGN